MLRFSNCTTESAETSLSINFIHLYTARKISKYILNISYFVVLYD